MPKNAIRNQMLARRNTITTELLQVASDAAQKRLIGMEEFKSADCIALYSAIQKEIKTDLIFEVALSEGKEVLFPAVCKNALRFSRVNDFRQLESGRFGILEPSSTDMERSIEEADLIVVPGLAFDLNGNRIGFGKGYYDQTLSRISGRGILIGLCHDFQVLESLQTEEHDIRMRYMVTDKRIIIAGTDQKRSD